ncbi:hypothetical protein CFC21_007640, partial [Triticum aestivum]
VSFKH